MKLNRVVAFAAAVTIVASCSRSETGAAGAAAEVAAAEPVPAGSAAEHSPAAPDATPAVAHASGSPRSPAAAEQTMTVYKSPTCGCCNKWVDHMRENGFTVEARDVDDLAVIKQRYKISEQLESCHTGVIGNYVVEGHVPADLVRRLLNEQPRVAGIAVPGMPMGSPGMEGATKQPYEVLTFESTGRTTVYAKR